jgi:glutamine---fructose-6-phosphate transaminase (isomerizing)
MSSTNLTIVKGNYFRDLIAQPAALEATLAWLRHGNRWSETRRFVTSRKWQRIVLTGMGSSFHVLHPLHLQLIANGVSALMLETSELVHYGAHLCDEDTLLVVVSQSGSSAETLRLLDLNRRAPILAITNTQDGELARQADCVLLSQAGVEFSVSCKTYLAALLIVQWLAALVADASEAETIAALDPVVPLVQRYLGDWQKHTHAFAEMLPDVRHLFLAGRGDSLAAVGTGALITKEASRLHAEGLSAAALRHGPMEMLQQDTLTLIFTGDPATADLNRRLVSDLAARGCRCDSIGTDATSAALKLADGHPQRRPLLEILPIELLTLASAALQGREAGVFEYASKITDIE